MKLFRNRILPIAALGLFAICANASQAAAQSVQGSFTLPNEVRWQSARLPAGDYAFSMNSTAMPNRMIVTGPNGPAFVLTVASSKSDAGQQSFLIIERRGVGRFVRELYLAEIGLHLRYSVPNVPKEEVLAQGPTSTEQVLVAMAGK